MAKKELTQLPKPPFSVGDRAAYIRKAAVALEVVSIPTLLIVTYSVAYDRVEVARIPVSEVSLDAQTKRQFYLDGGHISGGPSAMAKTHLSWLRSRALEGGATPDAIRLLSKATGAFTKKEENMMAEKLKAKSAAKPDTKGLKSAAKAAPVAKGAAKAAPKKRGNPEALQRAREARQNGPDTRKITALKKVKDIVARDGTYRQRMLQDLLSSKTVQEFREKDSAYSAGDLRYAQDAGYISLPAK